MSSVEGVPTHKRSPGAVGARGAVLRDRWEEGEGEAGRRRAWSTRWSDGGEQGAIE